MKIIFNRCKYSYNVIFPFYEISLEIILIIEKSIIKWMVELLSVNITIVEF